MAGEMLGRLVRWLRAPNDNAKAIEFAGVRFQVELMVTMGRPVPPDLQRRYDELLKWFIRRTGQLPPR